MYLLNKLFKAALILNFIGFAWAVIVLIFAYSFEKIKRGRNTFYSDRSGMCCSTRCRGCYLEHSYMRQVI